MRRDLLEGDSDFLLRSDASFGSIVVRLLLLFRLLSKEPRVQLAAFLVSHPLYRGVWRISERRPVLKQGPGKRVHQIAFRIEGTHL